MSNEEDIMINGDDGDIQQDDSNSLPNSAGMLENSKPSGRKESYSPYVYMEKIIDKLKLLNYERRKDLFPSHAYGGLPRYYFAHHDKDHPHEQFHTFIAVTTWLISDVLKLDDYERPDFQLDDPNTTTQNLAFYLKKMGIPMDFPPTKLRQAWGEPVCYVIDQLLNRALKESKVKLKAPEIPEEIKFRDDDEIPEESEDIEDNEDMQHDNDSENEDEMYYTVGSKNDTGSKDQEKHLEMIEGYHNAQEWRLETERLSSQLVVRLNVDHKDWRTHVESMEEQNVSIRDLTPSSTSQLEKIAEDIEKINSRIQKREKMLSDDSSIGNLLANYSKNQQELDEITKKYKELEETISVLSGDLGKINQDLSDIKVNAEDLTKKMADTTPLREIKEALVKIRNDIKQMDMRAGVLQNQVLQAKMKTSRVLSAKGKKGGISLSHHMSSGFEFDPFMQYV
ncbi:hypothetical protein NAEGRDRAFT_45002 [Naegleria gruberi]|uniref:Intraflagellar transport protein 57 n=1 Tax=Naegleria gruberi TaxID=5762 RepID=D2UXS1_NAEGR|nr:uncharacterized protein NAEGRDRAFT_45002 [Naegleria gruberi]EFC50338.1 hypothetical protein NAEGRDRAFT_45002 [Naegleria gruberi]|eukprot:XP_002683082.1 hypothetical protein NAEGRDRAFT_45002 [Naegleria gruberi strain NEG-M]